MSSTREPAGPAYPIESVDRALSVILAFQDTDTLTISEIGRQLGVSRSTAYRLLSVLDYRGFVRQDKRTKAFHAGPALLRVALAAASRSNVTANLHSLLERVVAATGETAHLVVLDRSDAFFMDCVESSKMIRATSRVGTSLPATITASGKVLLAQLRPDQLDAALLASEHELTRRSRTLKAFRAEINEVRERGWALNDGDSEVGLRAVATFVDRAQTGLGVDAAITVAAPAERLDPSRAEEVAALLRREAAGFTLGDPQA
jgi:IclR family transcriptional regulator, acetate operon repressor